MRARRLQCSIVATVAILALGACGSDSGGDSSNSGDGPTTTQVAGITAADGQPVAGSPGAGPDGDNGSGGEIGGSGATSNTIAPALLKEICAEVDPDANEPSGGGSGDPENYAAMAKGMTKAFADQCERNAQP